MYSILPMSSRKAELLTCGFPKSIPLLWSVILFDPEDSALYPSDFMFQGALIDRFRIGKCGNQQVSLWLMLWRGNRTLWEEMEKDRGGSCFGASFPLF